MSDQNKSIETDYELYVKQVENLNCPFSIGLLETYKNSRDIFDDIFFKQNLALDPDDAHYWLRVEIVGLFKYLFSNEKDHAINIWLSLIETNSTYDDICRVMYLLAGHFKNVEKNYEQAVQYYLMAIEKGSTEAMNDLACYYCNVEKNYEKTVQYFLMAIEAGDYCAISYLASHYKDIEKNYEKAIEYFVKGLKLGDETCLEPLVEIIESWNGSRFDLFLPIVRMIVLDKNLHRYWKTVNCALNDEFLQWKILNELSDVLDDKFVPMLKTLEYDPRVVQYKYKILRASRYGIVDTCPICLEGPVLNISIGCSHGVCPKCYEPNMRCVYRCPLQYNINIIMNMNE